VDHSPRNELEDLLLSMFTEADMRRFVRYLPGGEHMHVELPGATVPLKDLVHQAVNVLERHGRIDGRFFEALIRERPARGAEIQALATRMLGEAVTVLPMLETSTEKTPVRELNEVGTLLAGRYELRRLLARGWLSTVYQGHDLTSHRDVVVKLVRTHSKSQRDQLVRESRLLATLAKHSTGVVHYLDFVQHQDELYLVTEYIRGQTLQQWQTHEGWTRNEILAVYQHIAQVLHEIHQAGVVHRDLKPSNVMLAEGKHPCRIVLIDFGLAVMTSEVDELTGPGTLMGTPAYISPEILLGQTATPASDIFALGVMLCEALIGRPPWPLGTFSQIASATLTAPPELGDLTGTPLGQLITAMLAREPEARPRAVQVMHMLSGTQQVLGIPAQGLDTPDSTAPGTSVAGTPPVGPVMRRHGDETVRGSLVGIEPGDPVPPPPDARPAATLPAVRRRLIPLGIAGGALAVVTLLLILYREQIPDFRTEPAALLWLAVPAAVLLFSLGMRLRRSEQRTVTAPALPPVVEARLHAIERRLEHMSKVSSSIVIELGELRPHLDPEKLERVLRESILIAVSELKVGADAGDVGKAIKALANVTQRADSLPPWHKRMSTRLTLGGLAVGFAGGSLGLISNVGIWNPNAPPTIRAITVDRERATRTTPIELRVDAMDPEGMPLSYQYAATAGHLASNGPLALWHPDPVASTGLVRIDVTVSDGTAQVTQSSTLRINRRPELAITAPASAGRGATLQVAAEGTPDPDGDPLTYRWSASAGQFHQETASQPTLTAPAEPGVIQVHCTVSDGWETWDLDGKPIAIQ
jgi:predicted Ser/Thr protein kinase